MSDDDYIPPSSSSSSDGADSEQESTFPDESAESVSGMRKFLVFEHNLLDLFSMCQVQGCGKPLVTKPETSTKGFALSVRTTCIAGHDFRWNSQPSIKGTAACNILVPAAIFITGNSYSSFMELCDVMNLQALSTRQCYSVQRRYIIPEVEEMWELHNTAVLSALHGSALVLSGDARCDSPGHCASMGTYSLLDDASGLIIAQETIHVTDVANSYWLEIEGMKRSIDKVLVSIDFVLRKHLCCILHVMYYYVQVYTPFLGDTIISPCCLLSHMNLQWAKQIYVTSFCTQLSLQIIGFPQPRREKHNFRVL